MEGMLAATDRFLSAFTDEEWCLALHGDNDEHQCHKKPGHDNFGKEFDGQHECYCGVWW